MAPVVAVANRTPEGEGRGEELNVRLVGALGCVVGRAAADVAEYVAGRQRGKQQH